MKAVPLELKDANAYVEKYHRHHKAVSRDKFRVGCEEDGELVGVIQVGRPLSRHLCDGETVEVLRCCTNGRPNVASFLYSRVARIAREMGYKKIITYILQSEHGTSLKASGWICEGEAGRPTWSGKWASERQKERDAVKQISLFTEKKPPEEMKVRWAKYF